MGRVVTRGVLVIVALSGCGRHGFESGSDPDAAGSGGVTRVTIEITGNGTGTVVGNLGVSCSGGTCTLDVDTGTTMDLRGLATTESWLAGWDGPCGGNFDCSFVATADVTVRAEFSPRPNRVFVTSAIVDGAIGGPGGADALCATSAENAGLDGTWSAYLSDESGRSAMDCLAGSRGWIRVDGAPIADSPARFAAGPLIFGPRLDEYGDDLGTAEVFTGSTNGIAVAGEHCVGWTTNVPGENAAAVDTHWGTSFAVDHYSKPCDEQAHIVCIEYGRNVPVAIKPDTGRVAFVTSVDWRPGGGRASADALCASEAAAASLPGTYLAAIATSTEPIASRFAPGAPWRRVDGVRLTRDNTLFASDFLDVAPELDRVGQVVVNDFWTGAPTFDSLAESNGNCNDWTVGDDTAMADMHYTTSTWVGSPAKREPCDWAIPLLCLQE